MSKHPLPPTAETNVVSMTAWLARQPEPEHEELDLPPGLPTSILGLMVDVEEARQEWNSALIQEIDAAMPAEADFVNYELDSTQHLAIREVLGDYGVEIPKDGYEHISESLRLLGEPDVDFDGDLVLNSLGVFGWEREKEYDRQRDEAARVERAVAYEKWKLKAIVQQGVAIDAIRHHGATHVEALDFSWDPEKRRLSLAAVIGKDGRGVVSDEQNWLVYDRIAAYISDPAISGMVRSELTGYYRVSVPH